MIPFQRGQTTVTGTLLSTWVCGRHLWTKHQTAKWTRTILIIAEKEQWKSFCPVAQSIPRNTPVRLTFSSWAVPEKELEQNHKSRAQVTSMKASVGVREVCRRWESPSSNCRMQQMSWNNICQTTQLLRRSTLEEVMQTTSETSRPRTMSKIHLSGVLIWVS